MNKNNEMKAILGENLELMIRDIAFDHCSYIEEDEDQIHVVIVHSFDLHKNNVYDNLINSPNSKWKRVDISDTYDRQSELYETEIIFNKYK